MVNETHSVVELALQGNTYIFAKEIAELKKGCELAYGITLYCSISLTLKPKPIMLCYNIGHTDIIYLHIAEI